MMLTQSGWEHIEQLLRNPNYTMLPKKMVTAWFSSVETKCEVMRPDLWSAHNMLDIRRDHRGLEP